MVESFESPELLNNIAPDVAFPSLHDILKFPAGAVIYPLKEILDVPDAPAGPIRCVQEAITVVPSHNFAVTSALAVVVSITVTVPLTNHVPTVPCAILGPSKKLAVLLSATSAPRDAVMGENPAVKPVPPDATGSGWASVIICVVPDMVAAVVALAPVLSTRSPVVSLVWTRPVPVVVPADTLLILVSPCPTEANGDNRIQINGCQI